jgi:hypothetical protein
MLGIVVLLFSLTSCGGDGAESDATTSDDNELNVDIDLGEPESQPAEEDPAQPEPAADEGASTSADWGNPEPAVEPDCNEVRWRWAYLISPIIAGLGRDGA